MRQFKGLVVVLCLTLAVVSAVDRSRGYRCPENVSQEECNNYQCPKNAELVECINFCNTCEQATVCIDYCAPGCDCKAGFLRDTTGACIPKASCKKTARVFEEAESGGCPSVDLCKARCIKNRYRGGFCNRRNGCRCFR